MIHLYLIYTFINSNSIKIIKLQLQKYIYHHILLLCHFSQLNLFIQYYCKFVIDSIIKNLHIIFY